MNKLLLTAVALSLGMNLSATVKNVPYSSDIGSGSITVNSGVDPDWTVQNDSRKGKSFQYDRETTDFSLPGTSGGIYHPYDMDYAADCWAMSPLIQLTAGTEYTVSFWAKTRGFDSEKFSLCVGTEATSASMKTGQTLIDNPSFMSAENFTKQTVTYTPTVSGTYSFGIHCYSDANSYDFYITGFSITDGSGSGTDPVDPTGPKSLPFEDDFTSASQFATDWTSFAGPEAAVTSAWKYNSMMQCAEFDQAEGLKEDNWLVSSPINVENAGNFLMTVSGTIYGSMDMCIGTSPDDPTTFTTLASYENVSQFDQTYEVPFTLSTPGTYYIGFHAKAETGTLMGYRVSYVKLKENLMVPALVDDLKAVADVNDNLAVTLSWTNPDTDQTGGVLDAIEKVEILRNGEVVNTLTDGLTKGATKTVTDNPTTAGVYNYSVKVYNGNGCLDAEPMTASAGYVGHPVADMPFNFDIEDNTDENVELFTIEDANNDGNTWKLEAGSWSSYFISEMPSETAADDYIATPYLPLSKGYYRLETSVNGRYNSYEIGYATDRHDIAGTFVKCAEFNDVQESGFTANSVIIDIPQQNEYLFVVHHTGVSSSSAYLDIRLDKISLVEQAAVPVQAENMSAGVENGNVVVRWTNPTLDIAGNEMASDTQLGFVITRNDEVIYEEQPSSAHLPGSIGEYIDTSASDGELTYKVLVSNVHGAAEGEPAMAAIYFGDAQQIPYTATDFADWILINGGATYYEWEPDEENGGLMWSKYYGDPDADYAMTPYLTFEKNTDYKVQMTLANTGYSESGWALAYGNVARSEVINNLVTGTLDAESTALTEVIVTTSDEVAAADNEVKYHINAGNGVIGICPTTIGYLSIRAFAIEKVIGTGVETVAAVSDGLRYANGVVYFPTGASDVVICNVAGQVIYSAAAAPDSLEITDKGLLIIRAVVNGKTAVLKINR